MEQGPSFGQFIKEATIYLVLAIVVFIMFFTITQYATFDSSIGFLTLKQKYIGNKIWRVAFYIHVFTAIIALMAGLTQFSSLVLKEHKKLHRIVGKIYVYNILLVNVPSGLVLAIYANGHFPSRLAFLILDILWFYFTYRAIVAIRRRDINAHRRFMIRSYALTFSAITLRLWKLIFINTLPLDSGVIYMIDAWMGFVPNLLFAEWYIKYSKWNRSDKVPVIQNRS